MGLKANERFDGLEGRLCLKVLRNGEIIRTVSKNLIVTSGRNNLAKLLSGQTGMHVTQIGLGTGSVPPIPDDSGLTDAVLVPVTEYRVGTGLEGDDGDLFDDPAIVQFHFRIGKDTANGLEIREYGLFCADDSLFSRVIRAGGFVKTDIDVILGYWQIHF